MPSSAHSAAEPAKGSPRSLRGLLPFLAPYRGHIALAALFLVLAACATLVFPLALRRHKPLAGSAAECAEEGMGRECIQPQL